MPDEPERSLLDRGLVEAISLPADSRIPDPDTGQSTESEYDSYFRISRRAVSLQEWSATCLQVQREVLGDLEGTDLTADDREHLLRGFLVLNAVTMQRWMGTVNRTERIGP